MPSDQRDNIRDGLRGILRSAEEQLQKVLEDYIESEQVAPVVDTVRALPKNELAEMAETLVNLTFVSPSGCRPMLRPWVAQWTLL